MADKIFLQTSKYRKMEGLGSGETCHCMIADRKGNGVRLRILVWRWGVKHHKHASA